MNEAALRDLLEAYGSGEVDTDEVVRSLRRLPMADLGFARIDHHRALRQVTAETVYGPGKTAEQVALICTELLDIPGAPVVLTRADAAQIEAALDANSGATVVGGTVIWRPAPPGEHRVVVATAGTADLPVADECAAVLEAHGVVVDRLTDVGVAGIHRLFEHVDRLTDADGVVVVAGMEGALASVVGGLVATPVVAVPTSVGYGSSLEGVTALLGMLASCAAGLSVVGIDNGFGAAMALLRHLGRPAGDP